MSKNSEKKTFHFTLGSDTLTYTMATQPTTPSVNPVDAAVEQAKQKKYFEEREHIEKVMQGKYAGEDKIFAVKYTLDLDKKQFFPFFALGYRQYDDRIEFFNTKIPGTVIGNAGFGSLINQYGQEVSAPVLAKKLATVFMYRTKRPDWFDKSEQFVIDSLEKVTEENKQRPDDYQAFDGLLNPLISQVIKKIKI